MNPGNDLQPTVSVTVRCVVGESFPDGLAEMDVRRFAALSAVGTLVFESWLAVAYHYAVEFGLLTFF